MESQTGRSRPALLTDASYQANYPSATLTRILSILGLGSLVWYRSSEISRLGYFVSDLSFRLFRLGSLFGIFGLVSFVWDIPLEFFRLGAFISDLSFEICRLGSFVWKLWFGPYRVRPPGWDRAFGAFGLGSVAWDRSFGIF